MPELSWYVFHSTRSTLDKHDSGRMCIRFYPGNGEIVLDAQGGQSLEHKGFMQGAQAVANKWNRPRAPWKVTVRVEGADYLVTPINQ